MGLGARLGVYARGWEERLWSPFLGCEFFVSLFLNLGGGWKWIEFGEVFWVLIYMNVYT